MEITIQKIEKISRSALLKALVIGVLSIVILIPGSLIQNSIREKQMRNSNSIQNLSASLKSPQERVGVYKVQNQDFYSVP